MDRKFKIFIKAIVTIVLLVNVPVYADTDKISVKVKADVPSDFISTISVQYIGMNSEGFTAVLNSDNSYMSVIDVGKDIYTYKQSSVSDAYKLEFQRVFSTQNASKEYIYLLPIGVAANVGNNSDDTPIKVKFSTENLGDYEGSVTLIYTGTKGNSIPVTLDTQNNYKADVFATKDIYTLKSATTEAGYACECLYSFSLLDALSEFDYELRSRIVKQQEVTLTDNSMDTQAEDMNATDFFKKEIAISAKIPETMEFKGEIEVSYMDESGERYGSVLSLENNYSSIFKIPFGYYRLEYAISHDTKEYQFTGPSNFGVDQSTPEGTMVLIYATKDEKVVSDEDETGLEKTNILEEENSPSPSNDIVFFIGSSLLTLGLIFLVILIIKRRKTGIPPQDDGSNDGL